MKFKADVPLIHCITWRASYSAREIVKNHACYASSTVVNGWTETECAAAIAQSTLVNNTVGVSSRRTD